MSEPLAMKVGDTIWSFDGNRRVYRPRSPGELYAKGGPIYREHWTETTIVGETSRSWLVGPWKTKVPKKGEHRGFAFSLKEVEDDCWVKDYRHGISRAVQDCTDADTLKAIATTIGFNPAKP